MGFKDNGWSINNGLVTPPPGLDTWTAYRFILEAIYDGHLPVTRIIGYDYRTDSVRKATRGGGILERNKGCQDDRMTIVANLSKIVLLDFSGYKTRTAEVDGVMTLSNAHFSYSKKPIVALSTKDYILTSTTKATLDLVVNKCTDYRDASYNYTKIQEVSSTSSKTRFLPMFSYHNIIDFVRVLPLDGNKIQLSYLYGMTDDYLVRMFEDLFTMKLDKEWCTKFSEVLKC